MIYCIWIVGTREGKIAFQRSHMWWTYDLNLGMSEPSNYAYALGHLTAFGPLSFIHSCRPGPTFFPHSPCKQGLPPWVQWLGETWTSPLEIHSCGGTRIARGLCAPDWWFRDPKVSPISIYRPLSISSAVNIWFWHSKFPENCQCHHNHWHVFI